MPPEPIGRLVALPAGRVHVREDGPPGGRPIVLVHGYLGSLHWFAEMTSLLSDTFRVVRLDLLGHGCSDAAAHMDGRSQGHMVAELLEALDLREAVLVGHSFGNDATLGAATRSDRVAALVVISQAPDYSYARFPPGDRLLAIPLVGRLFRHSPASLIERAVRMTFSPVFRPPRSLLRLAVTDSRAMHPRVHREVIITRRRQLAERPLDAQLAETGLPAVAILGRQDRFYDAEKTRSRYAAAGADVTVLEDTGHCANVERPAVVVELVRDLANRNASPAPPMEPA